jgi:transcriptional regulator with XRE-family HTH domain
VQLRRWRERRELTVQGLADRVRELGGKLDRTTIWKIENKGRGVSLDEWLQLAHALAVPPPLLFLDLESGGDVEIAPGAVLHPWLAWEWVTGQLAPPVTSRAITRPNEFSVAETAVRLYRHEQAKAKAVQRADFRVHQAEHAKDPAALKAARAQQADALRELAAALDEMVDHEMTPPAKPREWVEIMRKLRVLRHPEHVTVYEGGASDGDGR